MCEYMGRATQDIPIYKCDYSLHYDLLTPPDSSNSSDGGVVPTCILTAHLYHPSWSRLWLCTALYYIVIQYTVGTALHCTALYCN